MYKNLDTLLVARGSGEVCAFVVFGFPGAGSAEAAVGVVYQNLGTRLVARASGDVCAFVVLGVPDQIVVAIFAKLTLYGFCPPSGRFTEILKILESDGATDPAGSRALIGGAIGTTDHAADAEIAGVAQDAVGRTNNEIDGGAGEGVVAESDAVQFAAE